MSKLLADTILELADRVKTAEGYAETVDWQLKAKDTEIGTLTKQVRELRVALENTAAEKLKYKNAIYMSVDVLKNILKHKKISHKSIVQLQKHLSNACI